MQITKIFVKSILAEVLATMKNVVARDPNKEAMTKPFYDAEKKAVVATDGRRMLVYYTDGLESFTESGYITYEKASGTVFCDPDNADRFPAWWRVLPVIGEGNYKKAVAIDPAGVFGRKSSPVPLHYYMTALLASEGLFINGAFFEDIKKISCYMDKVAFSDEKKTAPIVFTDSNVFFYVVMPFTEPRVEIVEAKKAEAAA